MEDSTISWCELKLFCLVVGFPTGFAMTYFLAETAGHKLRVVMHDSDIPVAGKLTCGAIAGAVAQSGKLTSVWSYTV